MRLSWDEIQSNAVRFSKRWEKAHREKADAQHFISEFLGVFGVEDPAKVGEREKPVKLPGGSTGYIDFFLKNQITIEMKSKSKDDASRARKLQSAYDQLSGYMEHIPNE